MSDSLRGSAGAPENPREPQPLEHTLHTPLNGTIRATVAILLFLSGPATLFANPDTDKAEPDVVHESQSVIGESLQGRPIQAFELGEGDTILAIIGGIHTGLEAETVHIVDQLFEHFRSNPQQIPARTRLVFIPMANPDGFARGARTNARHVDLNRNWPTDNWQPEAVHGETPVSAGSEPLSEPETRALYEYLVELTPNIVLSYHGYASLVDDNGVTQGADVDAHRLAAAYAEATGFRHIDEWLFYPITGDLITALGEEGIPAADVELLHADHNAFERNLRGVEAVLEALP
ncbi:MAG: M14 family zinc carboxypeptidase [bacterium]